MSHTYGNSKSIPAEQNWGRNLRSFLNFESLCVLLLSAFVLLELYFIFIDKNQL